MTKNWIWCICTIFALAACNAGGFGASNDSPYAPGYAGEADIDGLLVGHRLMAAGEFELALKSYTRAAGQQGLTVDVLSALGSANLRLGRLGQAEKLLRRAIEKDQEFVPAWNNLGVILIEQRKFGEAAQIFRRAFALDNGESDQIRDNLRLALAKSQDLEYTDPNNNNFTLMRRGSSEYLILSTS